MISIRRRFTRFLKRFGLEDEVKVNIEANHATLSGHTFEHEIAMARALGIFGSIDANRGDPQNGWDTDQFPNSVEELTLAMIEIIRAAGSPPEDSISTQRFAASRSTLQICSTAISAASTPSQKRCSGPRRLSRMAASMLFAPSATLGGKANWASAIHAPDATLSSIAEHAIQSNSSPQPASGRQEYCENLINQF